MNVYAIFNILLLQIVLQCLSIHVSFYICADISVGEISGIGDEQLIGKCIYDFDTVFH